MENLGAMEIDRLFQLFVGVLIGAAVIVVFIVVYVVISRRGDKAKRRMRLGTGTEKQATGPAEFGEEARPTVASPMATTASGRREEAKLSERERPAVDVTARLAGTGREAWLAEAPPHPSVASTAGERASYHGREVLRLVRDAHTGQFWVHIAGMRYRSLSDIRDRAVGERVLAAITHVLRFSNAMLASDQGVVSLELPACDTVKVPTPLGVLSERGEPGEILRLLSDPDQGLFCVYVADRGYHRLMDVGDRPTGQCILEAVTRLLQFSNGMLATNTGVGMAPVPPLSVDRYTPPAVSLVMSPQAPPLAASSHTLSGPGSTPASPIPSTAPSNVAATDFQERFLQQLISQTPSQSPTPLQRPSLVSSLRRLRSKSPSESLSSLNLADEINRIFQGKLSASPSPVNAGVEANPEGGVRIRVGTAYYGSPDEVPDSDLRAMLKQSIAEWERG